MSTQATATEAIRRSVTVDCSVEHAFETFTERIHEWWPLAKHSIEQYESGNPAETVVFQGGAGGQIYERTTKGEELKWADVVAYEPPHRFVLAWSPNRDQHRPKTRGGTDEHAGNSNGVDQTLRHGRLFGRARVRHVH